MKRNALLRSLAPSCSDTPRRPLCGVDRAQNSFTGKDSPRRSSLRPALGGSPARVSKTHRDATQAARDSREHHWLERESLTAAFTLPPVDHTFLSLVSSCCLPGLLISKVICTLFNESAPLCPAKRRCQLPNCDLPGSCPGWPCGGSRCWMCMTETVAGPDSGSLSILPGDVFICLCCMRQQ